MSTRQLTELSRGFVNRVRQAVLERRDLVLSWRRESAVQAADGGPLLLGRFNTASGSTLLVRGDDSGPALLITSSLGPAIFAAGTGGNPGVFGTGDGGSGVFGSSPAAGVLGPATKPASSGWARPGLAESAAPPARTAAGWESGAMRVAPRASAWLPAARSASTRSAPERTPF
jgi:hypothetical protein